MRPMFLHTDHGVSRAMNEPISDAGQRRETATNGDGPQFPWVVANVLEPNETLVVLQDEQASREQDGRGQHGEKCGHAMTAEVTTHSTNAIGPGRAGSFTGKFHGWLLF